MAGAEHPVIAADRADRATHLVGQGLEAQAAIGGGQGGREGSVGPAVFLDAQEGVDCFFEAASEQVFAAGEGDQPAGVGAGTVGQVEAVDGVEEEQRADLLVQVVVGTAKAVKGGTLLQERFEGKVAAEFVEGAIPLRRIGSGDDVGQEAHERSPSRS